jgi:hypothetical protein
MSLNRADERYAWLESRAVRNASDIALGCILLAASAAAILDARNLSFGTWEQLDGGFFPILVGWLLAVVGVLLIARDALGRAPHMRWKTWQIVLVVVLYVAVILGGALFQLLLMAALETLPPAGWFGSVATVLTRFGPSEWVAFYLLVLSLAVALARLSRLRAAGMMLLGLLLQIIGLDRITGQLRLTMGLEQLLAGIDFLVLAPGLILVADSMVCLISPALLLATYTRRIAGWRDPAVSAVVGIVMRVAAVLVIAAACYLAFRVFERVLDIGLLFVFGAFGVASKAFGWNRLVLLLAFSYGTLLEESIRQAMMGWGGDPTLIFWQPVGGTMLAAAGFILVAVLVLSLRRALPRNVSSDTTA